MKQIFINHYKKLLVAFLVMGIFSASYQKAYARESNVMEAISFENDSNSEIVNLYDNDGNIMAVYIPYSTSNPAPDVIPRYSANIDWNVGNGCYRGESCFAMNTNTKVDVNITITPNASSKIGLYDNDSHEYGFPSGSESSTGWHGTIVPSRAGNFSIAICNNTNEKVNYKGIYSVN